MKNTKIKPVALISVIIRLGFNTDHEFCDSLDALMLLDLRRVPEETILMLSKELTDIDVIGRFKKIKD